MIITTFILFLLLIGHTASVRVLDFTGARSGRPKSSLSSATLISGQELRLPNRFVLCFSTKLSKLDGKSSFVLYGENDKPWLAFSFWSKGTKVALWAEVQTIWTEFHYEDEDNEPWTHVWLKVCADV